MSPRERREADLFFAELLGRPSARQVPYRRSPEAIESTDAIESAEADTIDIAVSIRGMFGGDLSCTIAIQPKGGTAVTATLGNTSHDTTMTVEKAKSYSIVVTPTAAAPDDRYRKTTQTYKPAATATSYAVTVALNVNRWNHKNVYDTWKANSIDATKAKQVSSKPLCGRTPQVNKEAEAKLDAANKAFLALGAAVQQEIKDSLKIVGGYAFRTQTSGAFSNHSLGTAIDVNYHMAVKQNHHFVLRKKDPSTDPVRIMLLFVQEVVRTDATFATFDILASSTDLVQWDAAAAFNRVFPPYLERLVADAAGTTPTITPAPAATGASMPEKARALAVTKADVQAARKKTTDAAKQAKLDLVLAEWNTFQAWLYGADVKNDSGKVLGNMIGMIPMHRKFVELMVNAGWTWGGRWKGSKDYMHFEDSLAYTRLQLAPAAKTGEDDEDHEHEEHDVDDEDDD